ncbi:hypothetical protein TPHA_0D00160 [Tetrapisispora phaffii CBS 4417]|uniref:Protein FMP25, mitochondrial n=1 Tax=Tetrapisispora phaffii (strain ATCC 24235 / CBS 4417 / NBRC 1672 / NRRL Y-8282 / UCD 70-5) TaxID=1071381 RepID=G8BS39_TETPH|nr:hypothetical protein TPHA_0D00160 [Tetrapisispora phaffii CBS 4417]CCE62660.1 hypothetical protein TPHA_0D00160 [Tetrapisispora phaffii CBS 4417]
MIRRQLLKKGITYRLLNCNHQLQTFALLNKSFTRKSSNTPKYDEAELLAPRLTSNEYKADKKRQNFQWQEKSEEELSKEYADRIEKMAKLKAMLQGLGILVTLGGVITIYSKWTSIHRWYLDRKLRFDLKYNKDSIQKKSSKKKSDNTKSTAPILPIIPIDEKAFDVPGVYVWGQTATNDLLYPTRISQFDNQKFRDICLSPKDSLPNLAIDQNGDLIKWDTSSHEFLLIDQNLISVKYSNEIAYALTKAGKILIIPVADHEMRYSHISSRRSWVKPWKTYQNYNLSLDTDQAFKHKNENYIKDFDTGDNHLVLISNACKAYSCSTGITDVRNDNIKSYGQFGIPIFSQFDPMPKTNKLYEIELLNAGLNEDKKLITREIDQIACGARHTIAKDKEGSVFAFGSNLFGQLGLPISYNNEYVSYPKKIGKFQSYFTRDEKFKCQNIFASDETSFVEMTSQTENEYYKNNSNISKRIFFSFGNGKNGTLGNGRYKNSQEEPSPIKVSNNDSTKIEDLSCGGDFVVGTTNDKSVLLWGDNSYGQLANGKKYKTCKPQYMPDILKANSTLTFNEFTETKLHLNEKQVIKPGKNSCCIYWKS